jgi:outer membrane receptor for ferrienterochelin and colicins
MQIHAAAAAGFATACASSSSRPLSTACRSLRPMLGMALAAAGLLTHGLTAAQEKSLETVVVTASGFEQEIKDAPASISVITREELEKGSYNNLHDALRDVPGVNLVPSDNNSNDISLRGMGVNYTLILVDGSAPIPAKPRPTAPREPTRAGCRRWRRWSASRWCRPHVLALRLGRHGRRDQHHHAQGGQRVDGLIRTEATLQERSSSGNIYQSNFYLSGPIQTDLLGLSIYGNYNKRGEDNILNGYNDYDNRALNVKLALTPNKDHDIIAELGTGKQHYTSTPGKTLAATAAPQRPPPERDNFSLQHKGRWGWASSDTYLQQEKTRNLSRDMTIKNTVFNSSWVAPLGASHLLTTGVSYNEQDLTDTTTNTLPNASRTSINRSQWAVFAEDEWRLHKDFALTGGLRYDHDSQAGGQVSPRLYGVWNLAPQWTVKGGVSTGFRAVAASDRG